MAATSPDNILTPDLGDQYALTQDLGLMADSIQTAISKRANLYVGTAAQRTAFTTAQNGVSWQDTNGSMGLWLRKGGAWVGGDTGWVTLSPASGITADIAYRAVGAVVEIRFDITAGIVAVDSPYSVPLPANVRPSASGTNLTPAAAYINPDAARATAVVYVDAVGGTLRIAAPTGTVPTRVRGFATWLRSL